MTTKVLIVNMGNKPIWVEKQGRDPNGQFVDAGPKNLIPVHGVHEAYVYDIAELHITEKKD